MMRQKVSRRVVRKPDKIKRTLNLREFHEKRNRVLVVRGVGGLGDIFMHRMIFEDIKLLMPDAEITFACPSSYHSAVIDHPYIDHVVESKNVDKQDYIASYNTTTACGRYEMKIAPLSDKHRSDIWANHCGFDLTKHNMHIHLTEEEKAEGRAIIEKHRNRKGPVVVLCPVSAMKVKDLLDHQLEGLANGLFERGLCPMALHNAPVLKLIQLDVPMLTGLSIRQWMSVINQADYVISVDTAAFHCAGGMKKPLVGIFTFADGKVYGKYFDFFLVQKHRDTDPEWTCGPCYNWGQCPKSNDAVKPCLTELTTEDILEMVDRMLEKWPIYSHATN